MSEAKVAIGQPRTLFGIPEYRGLLSWVSSVDHKQIGLMYIGASGFFLLVAVALGVVMRTQLIRPENHWLSPLTYNEIFTMHGTSMACPAYGAADRNPSAAACRASPRAGGGRS